VIPGKHIGTVIRHDFGHSQVKGTPQFAIGFNVVSETGAETITAYVYLTEKAMGMARKSLKAIGFDPDNESLQTLVDNPIKLIGREASLTIAEEQRQDGEYQLKVAYIDPVAEPPKAGEIASLDGALRAVKGSGKKGAAAKAALASKTVAPGDATIKAIERHFTGPGGEKALTNGKCAAPIKTDEGQKVCVLSKGHDGDHSEFPF
jgi:hypothetical protein